MIQLNNLSIGYGETTILENLNADFEDGKIYGILAKSGVGKTTLLKTVAGLLKPIHGSVVIGGVVYKSANNNPVYMMHQKYSNFGWLSCIDNVLIAQRDRKLRRTGEQYDKAMGILEKVGLSTCADKWPSQLSGGMQQRLALARTLYVQPKYLLIDLVNIS